MQQKILVIEDEPAIADNITYALNTEGFETVWCTTGEECREVIGEQSVDIIVLDVGLPDINGFELCKEIRKTSNVPIIFLTARADEIDRVVGLEIGGDDYMVKPFSPRELTARIKAILRRIDKNTGPVKVVNETSVSDDYKSPYVIDQKRRTISYYGKMLDLTRYEYKILETLANKPERVYSREQLMNRAWDEPDISVERTIDTHIKQIRMKLKAIRPDFNHIETRRGLGYALRREK